MPLSFDSKTIYLFGGLKTHLFHLFVKLLLKLEAKPDFRDRIMRGSNYWTPCVIKNCAFKSNPLAEVH